MQKFCCEEIDKIILMDVTKSLGQDYVDQFKTVAEKQKKAFLKNAFIEWKKGKRFIVYEERFEKNIEGDNLRVQIKTTMAGADEEEAAYAKKCGYIVCDFRDWTVEKFKAAGVDVDGTN